MPSDTQASGGPPIPLCAPELSGKEAAYLLECVDSGWVSSAGPFVSRFEHEFAAYLGVDDAVATVNGTSALHLALLALGIRPEDEVILPALTFIAPANAVRYVGAWPVFMDVEPDYWQLDASTVRRFLEDECETTAEGPVNLHTGRRVTALLPVHILGHPVDMAAVMALAEEFGLSVIEDATESLGAEFLGENAGTLGHVGCFSFNGNKLLTTGSGGMLVARDPEVLNHARYLSTQAKDDRVAYVHRHIGFNYRLSNVQAAMGCAQLEQIERHLAAKRRIADTYDSAFKGHQLIRPMKEAPDAKSAFWMYTVLLEASGNSKNLMHGLAERGIQSRPLWQPLSQSPAHRLSHRSCPIAEDLAARALSLPSSVGLTAGDQRRVIAAVLELVERDAC